MINVICLILVIICSFFGTKYLWGKYQHRKLLSYIEEKMAEHGKKNAYYGQMNSLPDVKAAFLIRGSLLSTKEKVEIQSWIDETE